MKGGGTGKRLARHLDYTTNYFSRTGKKDIVNETRYGGVGFNGLVVVIEGDQTRFDIEVGNFK